MIPIYRQEAIRAFDNSLSANGLLDEAISRAGFAVFSLARQLLGGLYGRRVTVIFGPGNNGRDALVAASHLRRAGVVVNEVRYGSAEYSQRENYRGADLVIDGCFGVGLNRVFTPPLVPSGVPILSVDIPSGLNGDSGSVLGDAVNASATLCLTGLKLGALISEGPDFCGEIYLSELGLGETNFSGFAEFLIEDADLEMLAFRRTRTDHKWSHSVAVIAGSPGMDGAAHLACTAGYFVGSGIVHLFTDTAGKQGDYGVETVVHSVSLASNDDVARSDLFEEIARRFKSLVIGPGLGLGDGVAELVKAAIGARVRTVIDADAITAIPSAEWLTGLLDPDHPGVILTPHQGELKALIGRSSKEYVDDYANSDLCAFVRRFCAKTGVSLLVKGGPTVVGSPKGTCYLTNAPDVSLAVAGSGDVLSGMIGASLSYDGDVAQLAAVTAHLHGLAGRALGKGPSGELAPKARDILLRFESNFKAAPRHNFLKPTQLDGNLVGRRRLLEDQIPHRV